ncbi:hypothetical protein [Idiomarina seosinensis]|uniref:Uncharacterized protein n=1 Tax=Idiomarina seosinensis TaxID=281739 RepID=A0A432ZIN0_9GAMM|nr:hypothetical protein [Idiomarina seosinensis]RUO77773.1 hypothetical protein CWI81_04655 [Idiomarina seosinensis]
MKRSIFEQLTFRFNFNFEHAGHTIIASGNSITGNELVRVDGKSVSEKRVIAKGSEHIFTLNDEQYTIRFTVTGSFFCEVTCDLIKNGEVIASQHMRSIESKGDLVKMVIILFGVGLLTGFLAAKAALMVMG